MKKLIIIEIFYTRTADMFPAENVMAAAGLPYTFPLTGVVAADKTNTV
jgi:hypothetical protein